MSYATSLTRALGLVALLLALGLGLLYAYRSQAPAIPTVPITQAVQDVQAGKVKIVTETTNRATLELVDGTKEQTNVPDSSQTDPLADAITAYNRQNPTHQVILKYEGPSATWSEIAAVLLGLVPLVLIGLVLAIFVRALIRGTEPDRYAQLERIANLRDRGVLSEEEFQREKRKLIK